MRRFVRIILAASCFGVVPAIPASAGAADPRVPIGGSSTFELAGYCTFPVQVSVTSNEYIIHQSTAPDGTITDQITGNQVYTLTNETSGKSITYQANGPGTLVLYPDGAFSVDASGPNLFYTTPADSYPGVPYISYTTGHVTFAVDASGLTTAYSLNGRQTDVCQALGG
jgi:hypothetical protein